MAVSHPGSTPVPGPESALPSVTARVVAFVAILIGGAAGALVLVFAYCLGIGLVGAGLGALVAHMVWDRLAMAEPPPVAVVLLAVVGAAVAMVLQRYVIIVATAFGGAWTIIVGALALTGNRTAAEAASRNNVWLAYPLNPAPGQRWILFVWIALGIAGALVQLKVTAKNKT